MSKFTSGVIATALSLLPVISSLLFLTGDKYHDIRIQFWNHDPSQFPESAAEKISLGAEVLTYNVFTDVGLFSITMLLALIVLLVLVRCLKKIGHKLNNYMPRFFSFLKGREVHGDIQGNVTLGDKGPDAQIVVFVIMLFIYFGVIASIVFSGFVVWASKASIEVAKKNQMQLLSQYECTIEGTDSCEAKNLTPMRKTRFIFKKPQKALMGFSVECSPTQCIVFTLEKIVIGISNSELLRTETLPVGY
jgi:hypothetical protein